VVDVCHDDRRYVVRVEDATQTRLVREGKVPVIDIEDIVLVPVADIEIWIAVVVNVAPGRRLARAAVPQAGKIRKVAESKITQVQVKPVGSAVQRSDIKVLEAVPVIVRQGQALVSQGAAEAGF